MTNGWKTASFLVLWIIWNAGMYFLVKRMGDEKPEKDGLLFNVFLNLALWFAWQIGDVKRLIRERQS
jgi:hypothetical protein